MEQLLGKSEVARLAGVSAATIRIEAMTGKIRVAALGPNGTRLFKRADVDRYLRERIAKTPQQSADRTLARGSTRST
jgi:excisionase family DNA binding protein